MNALLTVEVASRLAAEGFDAYRHRLVPPNDGGLSLGQVAVAAAITEADGGGTTDTIGERESIRVETAGERSLNPSTR